MKHVRATVAAVENNYYIFRVCVCSLRYTACNTHSLYYIVISDFIFPHYLINDTIFEKKKLLKIKCVLISSKNIFSETFLILRKTERDIIKMYIGLHVKVPVILVIF
jgi:hypothetical protein